MKPRKVLWIGLLLALVLLGSPLFAEAMQGIEKMLIAPVPQADYRVDISLNKPAGSVYAPGENVGINVTPNRDSFIMIWNMSPTGKVHMIFPNQYDQDNFVAGGTTLSLPRSGYKYQCEGPGTEWVQVIASTRQFSEFSSWKVRFQSEVFPSVEPNAVMGLKDTVEKMMVAPQAPTLATALLSYYVGPPPSTGRVTLTSSPAGASILLDGVWLPSTTPVEQQVLNAGVHYVKLFKEGYAPVEFSFVLQAGEHKFFNKPLQALLQPARLIIEPSPADASVFLEGTLISQGRAVVDALKPGSYTVEVRKEGYHPKIQVVQLLSGETRTLNVVLERMVGTVIVNVDPLASRVKIGEQ
ncbi:MAG TPA: DUF4384 domain-containing protein, partial [Thermotogota bacterium]|nr:DUF4384 domain-containing protein [Thermotogota bacterium]